MVFNVPLQTYSPDTRIINVPDSLNITEFNATFSVVNWPLDLLLEINVQRFNGTEWVDFTGGTLHGSLTTDKFGNPLTSQSIGAKWGGQNITGSLRVVATNNVTFQTAITVTTN